MMHDGMPYDPIQGQVCGISYPAQWIFSERVFTFMFAICYHPSICLSYVCLLSVCCR